MNDMTIPQTSMKAPTNLDELQKMLDHVMSSLTAISQEASMVHQEVNLLQDVVSKELDDERAFEAKMVENAEKPPREYKLTKADYAYIKQFGSSWFDTSIFRALTGKSDGACTGFVHRVRHAENSQWIVNCMKAGNRRKIYQILPKETALHDAA